MKPERKLAPDTDIFAFLKSLKGPARRNAIELLGEEDRETLDRAWSGWAHDGQMPPVLAPNGNEWSTWVIKAGRGFGKTLAGAQWITARVAEGKRLRIALVGATIDDARRVMVEGKSGLIETAGHWIESWTPSIRRLTFTTGAEAVLFSGNSPDMLRGLEHDYAWCDELAKWERAQDSWDMLQLALRVGPHPRAIVTTTPKPGAVLAAIIKDPATVVTGGATSRNPHLPKAYLRRVEALYAGTRRGRQELDGELLTDAPGALWTVALIEASRLFSLSPSGEHRVGHAPGMASTARGAVDPMLVGERGIPTSEPLAEDSPSPNLSPEGERSYIRTLIAVDPPSGDGTCGIIACARDGAGLAHILADHSVTARSPEGWARAVADAATIHGTKEVVAEANQGGKMVKAVLMTADPALRVRLVNAIHGKTIRAEPVAHLFEAGKVRLHRPMPELEAQLLGMIAGGGYEGPGNSPDRADAMVWGVTELMLGRRGEARISF